jgi:HAD superfamily hydrolase (TIGR01490 family)
VAVFDLDGTITRRDTLVPYVFGFLVRHPWRLPRVLGTLPACVRFLFGRADPGAVKSAFIRATLGGLPRSALGAWTAEFVRHLLIHGVFGDARKRIQTHVERGDRLILLSASTDLYVPDIGARLGFEQVICTGLVWHEDVLDGRLSTPNRRGEEKVRCIERLRAQFPQHLFAAYGNAQTDLPHLRMVERPLLVNGSGPARTLAQSYGIPQATWH